MGVRDGPAVLAAPVRAPHFGDGPGQWTAAHAEAFAFFGGVPARLVPDNLKTGVDRPDLYDPKINRSYAKLAAHYGTLVDPARAAKPRDKAQVEPSLLRWLRSIPAPATDGAVRESVLTLAAGLVTSGVAPGPDRARRSIPTRPPPRRPPSPSFRPQQHRCRPDGQPLTTSTGLGTYEVRTGPVKIAPGSTSRPAAPAKRLNLLRGAPPPQLRSRPRHRQARPPRRVRLH